MNAIIFFFAFVLFSYSHAYEIVADPAPAEACVWVVANSRVVVVNLRLESNVLSVDSVVWKCGRSNRYVRADEESVPQSTIARSEGVALALEKISTENYLSTADEDTAVIAGGGAIVGGGYGLGALALGSNPVGWIVLGVGGVTLAGHAAGVRLVEQELTDRLKACGVSLTNDLNSGRSNSVCRVTILGVDGILPLRTIVAEKFESYRKRLVTDLTVQ